MVDTDDDGAVRMLGTIGDSTVYIVAEGPKARWCVDVLYGKTADIFNSIKRQVEDV